MLIVVGLLVGYGLGHRAAGDEMAGAVETLKQSRKMYSDAWRRHEQEHEELMRYRRERMVRGHRQAPPRDS